MYLPVIFLWYIIYCSKIGHLILKYFNHKLLSHWPNFTHFKGINKSRIIVSNWRRLAVGSSRQERLTTSGRHAVPHSTVVAAWGSQLGGENAKSHTRSLSGPWCLCTYQPPSGHSVAAVQTHSHDHYTTSRCVRHLIKSWIISSGSGSSCISCCNSCCSIDAVEETT